METFYQLFWDTRDAEKFHRVVQEEGFVRDFELPMVNRDGKRLDVLVSATLRRVLVSVFSGNVGVVLSNDMAVGASFASLTVSVMASS